MTIDDILNMSNRDFNKLSYQELNPIVAHLNKLANNRISRLEKINILSPALEGRQGMKFTISGTENLNQLRAKYREVADFMKLKTSTVSGAKDFDKMVSKSINSMREGKVQLNYDALSVTQKSKLWKLYNAIQEIDPVLFNTLDSDQKFAIASKIYRRNRSFENLRVQMQEYLNSQRGVEDENPDLLNAEGLFFA